MGGCPTAKPSGIRYEKVICILVCYYTTKYKIQILRKNVFMFNKL